MSLSYGSDQASPAGMASRNVDFNPGLAERGQHVSEILVEHFPSLAVRVPSSFP